MWPLNQLNASWSLSIGGMRDLSILIQYLNMVFAFKNSSYTFMQKMSVYTFHCCVRQTGMQIHFQEKVGYRKCALEVTQVTTSKT